VLFIALTASSALGGAAGSYLASLQIAARAPASSAVLPPCPSDARSASGPATHPTGVAPVRERPRRAGGRKAANRRQLSPPGPRWWRRLVKKDPYR
jgi:hypothetical protein